MMRSGPSIGTPRAKDRRSRITARCWFLAIALALPTGCDLSGKPNPADRPVPPEKVLEFSALFKTNCAGCHGKNGELGPAPPLNDSLFRSIVSAKELEHVITVGRPGTPMPGFAIPSGGTLTTAQIRVLVYEIKGIAYRLTDVGEGKGTERGPVRDPAGPEPQWGFPKAATANAPPYLQPTSTAIRTSEDCERIRKTVFASACAGCHGDSGQGMEGSGGPINDRSFLALTSNQALRRLVITGRPDLGMPDYLTSDGRDPDFKRLTSEQIGELVDLLASWRAGETGHDQSQARADQR
jgi:mono/diheme cytochrome c family protein